MNQDINYFRGRLPVDKHRLDDELEIQADHMDRITRNVTQAAKAEAFAKRELEQAEFTGMKEVISEQARTNATAAAAVVKASRPYQKAWEAHQTALEALRAWEGVSKAWYQRGFDLKALGELHGQQYFQITSVRGPVARPELSTSEFVERARERAKAKAEASGDEPQVKTRRVALDA